MRPDSSGISKNYAEQLTRAMRTLNLQKDVKVSKLGGVKISLRLDGFYKDFTLNQLNEMRNALMRSNAKQEYAQAFDAAKSDLSAKILSNSKRAKIRNQLGDSRIGKLFKKFAKEKPKPAKELISFNVQKPQFDFVHLKSPLHKTAFTEFTQALKADARKTLHHLEMEKKDILSKNIGSMTEDQRKELNEDISHLRQRLKYCRQEIGGSSDHSMDQALLNLQSQLK